MLATAGRVNSGPRGGRSSSVSHHANSDRPGLLRLFAALKARCDLTAADMPERSPQQAAHWQPDIPTSELPPVALPRMTTPAREAGLPRPLAPVRR